MHGNSMKNKTQKLSFIFLVSGIIILGITTLVISFLLQNKQPITEPPSRAAVDACKVTFTVSPDISPTATPSGTIAVTPTSTPSGTIAVTPTTEETPEPTRIPTKTPTPNPQCGQDCSSDSQCPNDHICSSNGSTANTCILIACSDYPEDCSENGCYVYPTVTPTRTPAPTRTPTTIRTQAPTRTPAPASCNANCTIDENCANGLICSNGYCRNNECTEQTNCSCTVAQATPTPEIPVTGTGTTLLGLGVIVGGILLLILGLAF
jgi:hypothetical protein